MSTHDNGASVNPRYVKLVDRLLDLSLWVDEHRRGGYASRFTLWLYNHSASRANAR